MSAGDTANQQELARFLRSRRERVNPVEVGLPVGSRRRTKGLRREEVAVLAGLSTSWYTYLEQGRNVRPSAAVLDSLARVLRTSEDERRYLHVLAHGQVSRPEPLETAAVGHGLITQALELVQDSPYPAYAGDHRGDLLAWNHAATQWYEDWGRYPVAERNIVRWIVLSPLARDSADGLGVRRPGLGRPLAGRGGALADRPAHPSDSRIRQACPPRGDGSRKS
jgi:transcriptional regulator with XRE-family HTH domain